MSFSKESDFKMGFFDDMTKAIKERIVASPEDQFALTLDLVVEFLDYYVTIGKIDDYDITGFEDGGIQMTLQKNDIEYHVDITDTEKPTVSIGPGVPKNIPGAVKLIIIGVKDILNTLLWRFDPSLYDNEPDKSEQNYYMIELEEKLAEQPYSEGKQEVIDQARSLELKRLAEEKIYPRPTMINGVIRQYNFGKTDFDRDTRMFIGKRNGVWDLISHDYELRKRYGPDHNLESSVLAKEYRNLKEKLRYFLFILNLSL